MAHFTKNLLEAFQDANDERAGGSPSSAGPFADPLPEARRAAPRTIFPALSARDSRFALLCVGAGLAIFVLGLATGRKLALMERVDAAEPAAPPPAARPAEPGSARAAAPAAVQLAPGEPVNAALRDPAYQYTVLAVTYDAGALGQELSYATYDHFAAQGLPVAWPLASEGKILVLVGVGAQRADLEELRDRVRELRAPDGKTGQYAEAYLVRIDGVLQRS